MPRGGEGKGVQVDSVVAAEAVAIDDAIDRALDVVAAAKRKCSTVMGQLGPSLDRTSAEDALLCGLFESHENALNQIEVKLRAAKETHDLTRLEEAKQQAETLNAGKDVMLGALNAVGAVRDDFQRQRKLQTWLSKQQESMQKKGEAAAAEPPQDDSVDPGAGEVAVGETARSLVTEHPAPPEVPVVEVIAAAAAPAGAVQDPPSAEAVVEVNETTHPDDAWQATTIFSQHRKPVATGAAMPSEVVNDSAGPAGALVEAPGQGGDGDDEPAQAGLAAAEADLPANVQVAMVYLEDRLQAIASDYEELERSLKTIAEVDKLRAIEAFAGKLSAGGHDAKPLKSLLAFAKYKGRFVAAGELESLADDFLQAVDAMERAVAALEEDVQSGEVDDGFDAESEVATLGGESRKKYDRYYAKQQQVSAIKEKCLLAVKNFVEAKREYKQKMRKLCEALERPAVVSESTPPLASKAEKIKKDFNDFTTKFFNRSANILSLLLFMATVGLLCVALSIPTFGLPVWAMPAMVAVAAGAIPAILHQFTGVFSQGLKPRQEFFQVDSRKRLLLLVTGMAFAAVLSLLVVPAMPAALGLMISAAQWKALAALAFALYVPALGYLLKTVMYDGPRPDDKGYTRLRYWGKVVGASLLMVPALMFAFPTAMVWLAAKAGVVLPTAASASAYWQSLVLGAAITAAATTAVQSFGALSRAFSTYFVRSDRTRGFFNATGAFVNALWPLNAIDMLLAASVVTKVSSGLTLGAGVLGLSTCAGAGVGMLAMPSADMADDKPPVPQPGRRPARVDDRRMPEDSVSHSGAFPGVGSDPDTEDREFSIQ